MVCFIGYKIPSFGTILNPIESGGCTLISASFIVVDNKRARILSRNILPLFAILLHQQKFPGKSMNFVSVDKQSDTVLTN